MNIDFKSKLFATLFLSFILLLVSLFVTYQGIEKNNKMIVNIEKKQMKLSYLANKLNHDIEMNQANVLQSIVLNTSFSVQNSQTSLKELSELVSRLQKFIQKSKITNRYIENTIDKITRRMVSYRAVQDSLALSIESKDLEDIQDAIIGFNAITVKFAQDIESLIDKSNEILYTKLLEIKESNSNSANTLIISFITAFTLIFFSM